MAFITRQIVFGDHLNEFSLALLRSGSRKNAQIRDEPRIKLIKQTCLWKESRCFNVFLISYCLFVDLKTDFVHCRKRPQWFVFLCETCKNTSWGWKNATGISLNIQFLMKDLYRYHLQDNYKLCNIISSQKTNLWQFIR